MASVANARLDNGSREHLRHADLAELVHVFLNPRHFLFTVETIAPGHRSPDSLVKCAIDVMLSKCAHYLAIVERPGFAANQTTGAGEDVESVDPAVCLDPSHFLLKQFVIIIRVIFIFQAEENARTSLNGRLVGLDAVFISPDLRRGTFRFTGEDHTLGAALRYCILRR